MTKFITKYNKKFDFLTLDNIRALQFRKIKENVKYAYKNSMFYKQLYDKAQISTYKINSFSDFTRLPIITKHDLRKFNWDIPAIKKNDWIDISVTSGTTGEPIYLPWSKRDFQRLAYISSILHHTAGLNKKDIVQITYPMGAGMWIAGLHNWLGLYQNGICSLRFGPGFICAQLENMLALKPNVILGSPSFLVRLGTAAQQNKIINKIKPRLICVSGENILRNNFKYNELGKKLTKIWKGVTVKPVYGASEGPICGTLCDGGKGYHIPSEFFYLEILDAKSHKVLKAGQRGLLAITVLGAEAFPLIRYILGDITFIMEGECCCGRRSIRLGPIVCRNDRLLKFKGLLINPEEIGHFIYGMEEVDSYYMELYSDANLLDQLKANIALKGKNIISCQEKIKDLIEKKIKSRFRLTIKVDIKTSKEIFSKTELAENNKFRRKPIYFFDLRKKQY